MDKPVGKTQAAGFQFGIRRTFPLAATAAWDFLFSAAGLVIWLGKLDEELSLQEEFTTSAGVRGKVRVLRPYSHIRLNWQRPGWSSPSTVQIRVLGGPAKATIAIHQEKLRDAAQRAEMKTYWQAVMKKLGVALEQHRGVE